MGTLTILEKTFGKYVAIDIHHYYVANLYKNVLNELNTKINETYKYKVICKKFNSLLMKVLFNFKQIQNLLSQPLHSDIPLEYNITYSDEEIHLKYNSSNFGCYCYLCFRFYNITYLNFRGYYFNTRYNILLDNKTNFIKSKINMLNKVYINTILDEKLLRNKRDEALYNYYKSKVPTDLHYVLGLK
jgi:hypothetical protein